MEVYCYCITVMQENVLKFSDSFINRTEVYLQVLNTHLKQRLESFCHNLFCKNEWIVFD